MQCVYTYACICIIVCTYTEEEEREREKRDGFLIIIFPENDISIPVLVHEVHCIFDDKIPRFFVLFF